jgi:MFS family permease
MEVRYSRRLVSTAVRVITCVMQIWMTLRLAFCGWFADHTTTRRAPLLCGLVALTGSTGMLCAASSVSVFIAGRILQGISAAVVWTTGLALLADTVGQKDVGHAMGYVSLAMSLGILVGPLLGGVVFAR